MSEFAVIDQCVHRCEPTCIKCNSEPDNCLVCPGVEFWRESQPKNECVVSCHVTKQIININ